MLGGRRNQVTCTIPAGLAPSASVTFVIPVTPTVGGAPVTNTARVSGGGDPGCPAAARLLVHRRHPGRRAARPVPVLRIRKEAPTDHGGPPGVPFDYILTVTNEGTAPTTASPTVTDDVPAPLTLGTLPPGCTAVLQW